jgi:hypothetical protein
LLVPIAPWSDIGANIGGTVTLTGESAGLLGNIARRATSAIGTTTWNIGDAAAVAARRLRHRHPPTSALAPSQIKKKKNSKDTVVHPYSPLLHQ